MHIEKLTCIQIMFQCTPFTKDNPCFLPSTLVNIASPYSVIWRTLQKTKDIHTYKYVHVWSGNAILHVSVCSPLVRQAPVHCHHCPNGSEAAYTMHCGSFSTYHDNIPSSYASDRECGELQKFSACGLNACLFFEYSRTLAHTCVHECVCACFTSLWHSFNKPDGNIV